jgi:hypothetical protein
VKCLMLAGMRICLYIVYIGQGQLEKRRTEDGSGGNYASWPISADFSLIDCTDLLELITMDPDIFFLWSEKHFLQL